MTKTIKYKGKTYIQVTPEKFSDEELLQLVKERKVIVIKND